jgi:hypothetical protein
VPTAPVSPRWWELFTVFLLGVVLLAIQHALVMSAESHEFSQILIVVVVFGLMFGWINKNAAALMDAESESDRPTESCDWPTPAERRSSDDQQGRVVVCRQVPKAIEASVDRLEPASIEPPAREVTLRGE